MNIKSFLLFHNYFPGDYRAGASVVYGIEEATDENEALFRELR